MPYLPNGSKNNMKRNPYQIYQVYRKQDLTKHLQNLLRFLFREINFFIGKKTVVETFSVAINDSSGVLCFNLYRINIFEKPAKAQRCRDVMFNLTFYCLFVIFEDVNLDIDMKTNILSTRYLTVLDSTLGVPQMHETSFRLIFPVLPNYQLQLPITDTICLTIA